MCTCNNGLYMYMYLHVVDCCLFVCLFVICSNQVGGELRLVDAIMSFVYATPTLTPNHLADSLHPLLNMSKR